MIPKLALLAILLVAAPALVTGPHYLPTAGDGFTYRETVVLDNGVGNYSGYTEHQWINGTENVTARAGDVTSAYDNFTDHWVNNQGGSEVLRSPTNGDYNFSASSFQYLNYVSGTDGQYNYTAPFVWYYINNATGVGSSFYLLDTELNVTSRDASFPLSSSRTGYVATISALGTGAFGRDDSYGIFTAKYTWTAYFDPATGYIVGYVYTEQDRDLAGDGFTWTDELTVTHTSYPLTPAAAPPASSTGPSPLLLLGLILLGVLVVVVVISLYLRSRRRTTLPQHSAGGRVNYFPGAGPAGPPPPPIGLIPSGEPAVQQIVMRETVKVNCRYCGTLIDTTATACPKCGAPRT
ncbi:MAG: zinc ribbon domain-containing protein [Thermoplasmata archaeon]